MWFYSGHPALRPFGVSLRLLKIAPGDFVEPLDCMTHIPVRHPSGDLAVVANRQSCRFVIARLAVLVPRPRVNLTRYHEVLAPNHRWRAEVTPSGRGRRKGRGTAQPERSSIERHAAMTWAQRLKRVFDIDVETCVRCGKAVRVIASIEEQALIQRILAHVRGKAEVSTGSLGPPSTGPPVRA